MEASVKPGGGEGALSAARDIAGLEPMEKIRRRWPSYLGALLTVLMVCGIGYELLDRGLVGLLRTVPTHPLYYVAFLVAYLIPPTFDWFIFRKLWRIPLSGMVALHKKRISNEVLVGYSGEAYFYAWARQRTQMVTAPFGAVKDVMIMSALAGHAVTLAIVAIALPLGLDLLTGVQQRTLIGSVAVIVAMTLPFVIFSKRVFSLRRPTLWWVFGMQCLRLIFGNLFLALAWYFALPDVSVPTWFIVVAGRLLVSRLPLVSNKDLLFANFAIILMGQEDALTGIIAFTAALTLLAHVLLICAFGIHALTRKNT